MGFIDHLVEERFREAMSKGELDELPGKGKPLQIEDLSAIPEELRAGYLILKNAGVLPSELQLNKDMVSLRELIANCDNDEERSELRRQLNEKSLRFQLMMERQNRFRGPAFQQYEQQIRNRLGN